MRSCTAPGGTLCLSGIRPGADADVLRALYSPYFDFDAAASSPRAPALSLSLSLSLSLLGGERSITVQACAEKAPDAHGAEYWGTWALLVATRRTELPETRRELYAAMADGAIS